MTAAGAAPERPAVATPGRFSAVAHRQPALGALGLLLVVPSAWLIGLAFGPRSSVRVLGPLVTFAVPAIVMISFWWENWPGTRLRPRWSGWADTVLIAMLAVVCAALGQAVTGATAVDALPETMPLAGLVFVVMLQLTFACEGWPLRGHLPPLSAGLAALACSWLVAVAVWLALPDLGALPVLVGAVQVWIYVAWGGWPFSGIDRRRVRLPVANAAVIAVAGLAFAAARGASAADARIMAVAGSFVAAALIVGMLFEGWLGRWATLAAIVVVAAALEPALQAYAAGAGWTSPTADEWVTHATLNAIGVAIILHVAVGRRWPLA